MPQYVFLVVASDVEGATVLAAFEAKRDAEALAKRCSDYESRERPVVVMTDDTPEGNTAFDKQWAKFIRWQKRHPGGERANSYDTFGVQRMRLQAPARFTAADRPKEQAGADEKETPRV